MLNHNHAAALVAIIALTACGSGGTDNVIMQTPENSELPPSRTGRDQPGNEHQTETEGGDTNAGPMDSTQTAPSADGSAGNAGPMDSTQTAPSADGSAGQQQSDDSAEGQSNDRISYSDANAVDPETWGDWGTRRQGYNTVATLPAPTIGGSPVVASGSMPTVVASYSGPINGTMNPYWPELSDPRIVLGVRLSGSSGSITAETTYDIDGEDTNTVLTRYSARLNPDGTFDAFDGVTPANPSGVNGTFHGSSHEVIQGHIVTPFVFGSYKANKN